MENDAKERVFFADGIPQEYVDKKTDLSLFANFSEAYHRLMIDLVSLTADSINLIIEEPDSTEDIYITGGFAKNPLFVGLLASCFPDKKVYTSDVANSTSLGAALVIWNTLGIDREPEIDLGLKKIESI